MKKEITMSIHQFMELERGNTTLKEINNTNDSIKLLTNIIVPTYITTIISLYILGLLASKVATQYPGLIKQIIYTTLPK